MFLEEEAAFIISHAEKGETCLSEVVREYYDKNAEREWERLVRDPYHKLEFIITMHFLDKHLPKKGLVLDAGGGPGRYTIELAKRGYEIVLQGLSPDCLKVARREIRKAGVRWRIKRILEGSNTDLSEFADGTFDAVLCLGTLSHLLERRERESAASELVRVAKKKAPLFVSVISLYGVFRTVLQRLPYELVDPSHEEMFSQGVHRAEWHKHETYQGFPDAYFFHPAEVKELFESHQVETLEVATCEGLSSHLSEETNRIYQDKKKWKSWLKILLKTCTDPTILGLGEHFLYIGRRT
jgi:2-polyprenyl-3-methyl-5-hydroxy-6-metoxy-1,4-benzoquinol methylase